MSSPEDRPQAPIVRLEQVSVRHAATGRVIVSDVGFTLARGRCLGIVGESGSGKTLICRTLLGLLPPALAAEGQAFFGDIDMINSIFRNNMADNGGAISSYTTPSEHLGIYNSTFTDRKSTV